MEDGPSEAANDGSQNGEEIHWRFSQIKGIIEEQPTDGIVALFYLFLLNISFSGFDFLC